MMASWEEVQQAFIDGYISFDDLVEVLVDNFGLKKTNEIIKRNLELSLKDSHKNIRPL